MDEVRVTTAGSVVVVTSGMLDGVDTGGEPVAEPDEPEPESGEVTGGLTTTTGSDDGVEPVGNVEGVLATGRVEAVVVFWASWAARMAEASVFRVATPALGLISE